MKKYWKTLCAAGALVLLLVTSAAGADHTAQVLQVSTNGQNAVFFIDAAIQQDIAVCKVSNQSALILSTGTISDGNAIVKTTILIDISTSIPTSMRDNVVSAIDTLIEQKSPNDEYRLVTFGQEETVLCDFTADRYDLGKAVRNIAFDGQSSMIYDAVYHTIPDSYQSSNVPTFYRTIVITDGVDLTKTGITKEELFLKLQSDRYPVEVLAVSAAPEEAPNKELAAIARISGGRYCALDPNTDLSSLGQALGVSDYSYLEVQVPEQLLDGSVRQVDLIIGSDTLSLDVKFPAIYEQPEPGIPAHTFAPEPSPTLAQAAEPKPEPKPVPEPPEPSFMEQYGLICVAAAAVAVAVLIVVIVLVLKRKKKQVLAADTGIVFEEAVGGQETVHIVEGVQYTIKISAPRHPGLEWVLEIAGEVLIGRANYCEIRLEDKTVSREHCKIVARQEGLEAVHVGSNHTIVNGVKVVDRCPLNSGDLLNIGREQLRVDYIQKLNAQVRTDVGQMENPAEQTLGFFER